MTTTTTAAKPIRGKVARVLNNKKVALNKGVNDGVMVGMVFSILSPYGSDITDPDTGETLGSVEMSKATVKVTDVQERLSVASTFRTKRVNIGGEIDIRPLSGVLERMFEPPKWETRQETLRTDENTEIELSEEDSRVKTGDPVVQVIEPEAAGNKRESARMGANA